MKLNIFEIPKLQDKLTKQDIKLIYEKDPPYPKFQYGFQSSIHQLHNILKDHEKHIDLFNKYKLTDLNKYLKKVSNHRDYYIMHELLVMFNLVSESSKSNVICDNIYKDVLTHFNKNISFTKTKSDLIILSHDYKSSDLNNNLYEQDIYQDLLSSILDAMKNLKSKSNLVIKISESFTDPTVKLIGLLTHSFDNIYIVRPDSSTMIYPDKYLVCLKYDKNLDLTINNKSKEYIYDISGIKLDDDFIKKIVNMNCILTNMQFKSLNLLYAFIDKQNYLGDDYNTRLIKQEKYAKKWYDLFFGDNKIIKEQVNLAIS